MRDFFTTRRDRRDGEKLGTMGQDQTPEGRLRVEVEYAEFEVTLNS